MNHLRPRSKVYSLVIALMVMVFTSIALVAAKETRLTGLSRLEELGQIKDDILPADARLTGPSRLEQLAHIKDDMFPANARLTGPSRLEELRRIKEDMLP